MLSMTNNELYNRLSAINQTLLSDNAELARKDIVSLMFELRPEMNPMDASVDSYVPIFFTLQELTASTTASKLKLKNSIPNDIVKTNLLNLCRTILDPARDILGSPIYVSSGYRSVALNAAVGGVPNSRHTKGLAADVSCYDNNKLFDILNSLPHSELIYHSPHYIHVAL